uniref:Protein mab-21-like 1-like n=1 Tax=Saccoglossus kowalevskii TaxID=10224 RepID=A0ABM0LZX8_SACKO|nr:PREDICTED: protein mab-21-like 1-like [Saccoglossus kowalevskii]
MSGVQFRQKNFFSMVHKWSNTGQEDDGIKLKISAHGPAVQVDLTPPRSTGLACDISVDLVPTLRIREDAHYVAKPYKSYAEIHTPLPCDSQLLWRQSFSKSERAILKKIDGDGGCRKDCCRILKSIRNEDPTLRALTSYHLKTALLHECDIVKDWDKNKLDQRFLGMLGSLAKYSREKSLPHYFVPELNLMEGYKNSTLDNIHGRLSRLQNSPLERSKLLSPTEIKNK